MNLLFFENNVVDNLKVFKSMDFFLKFIQAIWLPLKAHLFKYFTNLCWSHVNFVLLNKNCRLFSLYQIYLLEIL